MKKLTIALIFSALLGCSSDYSVALKNGYFYNHWGNNFISLKANGAERQVIEGQVDSYSVHRDYIFATQSEPSNPSALKYWIINMTSHEVNHFENKRDFDKKLGEIKNSK